MSAPTVEVPTQDDEATQERLRRQIAYCAATPFYAELFERHSIDPGALRTLEDVRRMPVLVTPEVHRVAQEASDRARRSPVRDLPGCAAGGRHRGQLDVRDDRRADALRVHRRTTSRSPTGSGSARCVSSASHPGDCVLQGFGLSMYLAGIPLVRALERMGARPVPIGAEAGAEKLLRMARLVRPRVLACTPSYAEHLLERVPDVLGMSARDLGVEVIICAGEPGAGLPEVRRKLEEGWGAQVFDMLGGAHGIMNASCGYPEYQGMHVLGNDYSVSTHLVDPTSGEPLDVVDGVIGERVKTSIEWEAQPPLRYSVGDVYQVFTEACPCGRPGLRVKVLGRVDDLLIVKGVKIYPGRGEEPGQRFRARRPPERCASCSASARRG